MGQNVKAQLEADLKLEENAVEMYNKAIQVSREAGDDASRELFSILLKDEEMHVDWLEAQLHQIKEMGYERYLSNQTEGSRRSRDAHPDTPGRPHFSGCASTVIATEPRMALEMGQPFSAPVASSWIVAASMPFSPSTTAVEMRRGDLDARLALVGGDGGRHAHT